MSAAVLVSSPQDLALMVVRKTLKMAEKLNVPILGLLENMSYVSCPSCGDKLEIFGPSQGEATAEAANIPFIGCLPWDPSLNAVIDKGEIDQYRSVQVDLLISKFLELIK